MFKNYHLIFFCSFLLLLFYLFTNQVTPLKALDSVQKNNSNDSSKELEDLKKYALTKINEDRKSFGFTPVLQSTNTAAQIQANELLKTNVISHWTPDGFKPYMLYSLYNGTGYVQQNIGQISYINTNNSKNNLKSFDLCSNNKKIYCTPIDPYKAIANLEYSMIYDDLKCCNNGHKNNTLDKFHTHVSLGIAFNKYYFVMVQNFENHYLDSNYTIQKDNEKIKLEAKILEQNNVNFKINHVSFFLDDNPTKLEYEKNKNKNHYEFGDLKLMVSKPLSSNEKYLQQEEDSYTIIEAKKWESDNNMLKLEIKLPESLDIKNKVLTMVVYAEKEDNEDNIDKKSNNKNNEELIPLTSYTFF
ncbi:MAG: hypothetical protein H0X03_08655 [Nitrosopumilus sp.]|nr:hypothetical protein [Nitrosopumilus sp.]